MPSNQDSGSKRTIAMVAHDKMKPVLLEWAMENQDLLRNFRIVATGTTGRVLSENLKGVDIECFKSGPLGGDLQIGAMISTGDLEALFFLVDPMTPQPHDVDVKALIRISTLYETPVACNRTTADFVLRGITDPAYVRRPAHPMIEAYVQRSV
ncbi:methylglyoxal synthase [Kiloniella laminariae]|uniref:methylglyoxal synthase n=1 Tax=Kiloniella laminariae TaxID=454162 RepID=UPI00036EA25B|nr:methylglyoxal synthase [Kiloniella laminariae]